MKVVIDTNVIMAMLINPGKPIDLFFKEELEIFAPKLLLQELENNKDVIILKSDLDESEIEDLLDVLRKKIKFVSEKDFIEHIYFAEKICPDSKDIIYFALALHLKCAIWTNEKKLAEQQHIKIYSTHELISLFGL